MEDSKKAPPQPKESSSPNDKIIDLTPEMEVISSANRGKIIDLTQVLFSPGAPQSGTKAVSPAAPKPIVARTTSPFSAKISRKKGVESNVDAAFDFIQSKAEALRGPRVEPTPDEADLKVSAPRPIGDWDEAAVKDASIRQEPQAAPVKVSNPEPVPVVSPMQAAVSEARAVIEAEHQPPEDAIELPEDIIDLREDVIELIDIVPPDDSGLLEETSEPPALAKAEDVTHQAPVEETDSVAAMPDTLEYLDEEPASLLESAIELDEDEEIIELTDMVSPEELAAAQAAEEDDEIIELTEIVSPEELSALTAAPELEEEIIELTDIVSPEELAAAAEAPAVSEPPVVEEEEEIIELVDRIELPLPMQTTASMAYESPENPPASIPEFEPAESETTPAADDRVGVVSADAGSTDKDIEQMTLEVFGDDQAPAAPAPKPIPPEIDQVIRLDSVLGHARRQEKMSEEITMGVDEALARESIEIGEKFPIGLSLKDVKEALDPGTPTEAEIEAVIEKVIRSKYGHTIEQMIASVVEKVVTREMENIKRNLMEDQGESDEE